MPQLISPPHHHLQLFSSLNPSSFISPFQWHRSLLCSLLLLFVLFLTPFHVTFCYHLGGDDIICLKQTKANSSCIQNHPEDTYQCDESWDIHMTGCPNVPSVLMEYMEYSSWIELKMKVPPNTFINCTHGNFHACKPVYGVCWPNLQSQPNLISLGATVPGSLVNGTCLYKPTISLSGGDWNMIAHVILMVNDTKYDLGISCGSKNVLYTWFFPVIFLPISIAIVTAAFGFRYRLLKQAESLGLPEVFESYFSLKRIYKSNYNSKETQQNLKYYYKTFRLSSSCEEIALFNKLKIGLNFGNIPLAEVKAVVPLELVKSFCTRRRVIQSRMKTSPGRFLSNHHLQFEDREQREWILSVFRKKALQYRWNENKNNESNYGWILPVVHGTDKKVARSILLSGFAALSSLDDGWYGKGMYFSTNVQYCIPYIVNAKIPTVMVCLLLPGNPFPVTELHIGKDSLCGKPLKTGYQSHYVITSTNGTPVQDRSDSSNDEIVINQEPQVVPIFVVTIQKEDLSQYIKSDVPVPPSEPALKRWRDIISKQKNVSSILKHSSTGVVVEAGVGSSLLFNNNDDDLDNTTTITTTTTTTTTTSSRTTGSDTAIQMSRVEDDDDGLYHRLNI